MQVKSLGYRTDLIFPKFDGEILDRGNYLVIRTPSNPTFYWGNFLLFSDPPDPGDDLRWRSIFIEEIGCPPDIRHQTFGWDTPSGESGHIQPFLDDGFQFNDLVVLTINQTPSARQPASGLDFRPLQSEDDWDQATENQIRCREPGHEESHFRIFKQDQMLRYRKMERAQMGAWYGVFIGGELVGDLGIIHDQELGRFQSVETHPAHRRQGIASSLICSAASHALEQFGIRSLVMVADKGSPAERLYKSLGFEMTERQVGLEWWKESP